MVSRDLATLRQWATQQADSDQVTRHRPLWRLIASEIKDYERGDEPDELPNQPGPDLFGETGS